ncbi:MAG: hypothetical protein K1X88_12030 [Nannocystaceae bacterium]|nr:hypothetical protein [Nannocystaceae bacterium]
MHASRGLLLFFALGCTPARQPSEPGEVPTPPLTATPAAASPREPAAPPPKPEAPPRFAAAQVLAPCEASVLVTLADTDERDRPLTIERTIPRWTEHFGRDYAGPREPIAAPVPVARETLLAAGGRQDGQTVIAQFADDAQPLVYGFDEQGRTSTVDVVPASADETLRFRYAYSCSPPPAPRTAEIVAIEIWRRSATRDASGNEIAPWTRTEFGAFVDRRPLLGGLVRVALPGGHALERRIVAIESLAVSTGVHIELEPSDDAALLAAPADAGRREEFPFDAAGVYPASARPKLALVDRGSLTGALPVPADALELAIDLDGDGVADQLRARTSPEHELGCRTIFDRKAGRWRARREQCGD